MDNGMNHTGGRIVNVPVWITFIHIAQALLAVIILGLVSYSYHFYNSLDTAAFGVTFLIVNSWGFNLFTCIYTWIIIAYIELSRRVAHNLHNMWAALLLEILGVVFWLGSFASLAAYISGTLFFKCNIDQFGDITSCNDAARNTSQAAAGLGGLEFILFLITAIITAIHTQRHHSNSRSNAVPLQTSAPAQYSQETPKYDQGAPAQYGQGNPVQYNQTSPQYNQAPQQQYNSGPQMENGGQHGYNQGPGMHQQQGPQT